MKQDKAMRTEVSFCAIDSTTTISFYQQDDYADRMYFSLNDGNDQEEEYAQCTLSLDEMEYLANRMLDAVSYQRKMIEQGATPMSESEEYEISEALHKCGYDRKRTASELGISERTLYRKMQQYNL